MRKFGLAAVGAFALAQSCCTPEPQETREVTMKSAAQSAPATPPEHLCEIVRHSVRQRALRGLAAGGLAPPGVEACFEADKAAQDCYEEERMRADCDEMGKRVSQTVATAIYELAPSPGQIALSQGSAAEEECLAGYGLAPEEEDRFVSR